MFQICTPCEYPLQPQDCDPALLRRFERRVFIPFPDDRARHAFFLKALLRPEMDSRLSSEEVGRIVEMTEGEIPSLQRDMMIQHL